MTEYQTWNFYCALINFIASNRVNILYKIIQKTPYVKCSIILRNFKSQKYRLWVTAWINNPPPL